jgi:hypothetical protein
VQAPSPQCDVSARLHRFVDVYEGKTHDGKFQRIEKGNQFFILPTPIELNGDDLATSHALNKLLKFKNEFRHFKLMTKKIDPSKFVIIINETYTVFFWPKESMAGPHTSE